MHPRGLSPPPALVSLLLPRHDTTLVFTHSGLPGNFQKCSGEQCVFERGYCFKPKHWVCVTLLCYYGYSLFSAVTCGVQCQQVMRVCVCVFSQITNPKQWKKNTNRILLTFSLHVKWIQSEAEPNFKTFVRPKYYQRAQKSKVGRGEKWDALSPEASQTSTLPSYWLLHTCQSQINILNNHKGVFPPSFSW